MHCDDLDSASHLDGEASQRRARIAYVVYKDNCGRILWDYLLLCLILYTAAILPYRVCFEDFNIGGQIDTSYGLELLDIIVDVFFWCDLLINFVFTFEDGFGREVDNLWLIARNYLGGHFTLNLIACLPKQVMEALFDDGRVFNMHKLVRIARLPKACRLARLINLAVFWRWIQESRKSRPIRLIYSFILLLFFVHLLACSWYLCAALHHNAEETWVARRTFAPSGITLLDKVPAEQWAHSVYVLTTCLFESGDLSAETLGEIPVVCFVMFVGALLNSIIISEVINIVFLSDLAAQHFSNRKQLITAFIAACDIREDSESGRQLDEWLERTRASYKTVYDKEGMRALVLGGQMPQRLILTLPKHVFGGKLIKNQFLYAGLPEQMVAPPATYALLIALSLTQRSFSAGEIVYQANDQASSMYLILGGTFANIAIPSKHGGINASPFHSRTGSRLGSLDILTKGSIRMSPNPLGAARQKRISLSEMARTRDHERLEPETHYPYMLFGSRCYFGDYDILSSVPVRRSSMRCESEGCVLTLLKSDLFRLTEDFPYIIKSCQKIADRREMRRQRLLTTLYRPRTYKQYAATQIQAYFRCLKYGPVKGAQFHGETDPDERIGRRQILWSSGGTKKPHVAPQKKEERHLSETVEQLQNDVSSLRREVHQVSELLLLLIPRPGSAVTQHRAHDAQRRVDLTDAVDVLRVEGTLHHGVRLSL